MTAVGELLLAWLAQECTRQEVPLGSCDLPLRSPKEQDAVGCAACLPAAPNGASNCAAQAGALPRGRDDGPTTCAVPPKAGQVAGTDEVM
ncbi:MAG: hypothetical protein HYZ92_04935 [Candidatus Omnitrophica bacterium]|nr:hypothetical protein [Candidatus Omnitrophota bacterium]